MGLDMYAYVGRPGQHREFWDTAEADPNSHEFISPTVQRPREIAYWRKHPNLHGWMERLWQSRLGVPHDKDDQFIEGNHSPQNFNGVELELTWDDIMALEADILAGRLPPTTGFFFGDNADGEYREQDLEFCAAARAELFLGQRVFYNSSW